MRPAHTPESVPREEKKKALKDRHSRSGWILFSCSVVVSALLLLVVVVVVVRRRGREEEGGGETAGCPRSKPDDDGSVPNARRCDAAPCPADGRADGRTGACLEPALSVPPLAPAEAPRWLPGAVLCAHETRGANAPYLVLPRLVWLLENG